MRPILTLILVALGVPGCVDKQINQDVHTLNNVTRIANERHKALCAPPDPQTAAVPPKPAGCDPLVDCVKHLNEATRTCTALQQQRAQTGQGDGAVCTRARDAALALCRAAGVDSSVKNQEVRDGGH